MTTMYTIPDTLDHPLAGQTVELLYRATNARHGEIVEAMLDNGRPVTIRVSTLPAAAAALDAAQAESRAARKSCNACGHDRINNEGGDGYNPHNHTCGKADDLAAPTPYHKGDDHA